MDLYIPNSQDTRSVSSMNSCSCFTTADRARNNLNSVHGNNHKA